MRCLREHFHPRIAEETTEIKGLLLLLETSDYNPFWRATDITQVCTIGDASGLDIAAQYLNQKPNAERLSVRVSPLSAEFFGYYFKGRSYRSDREPARFPPDYEVAYIRDLQIGRVHLEDTQGTLEHIIRLNGLDYVWIYKLSSS